MDAGVCGVEYFVFSIFVERWVRVPTINHIITNIITKNHQPLAGLTIPTIKRWKSLRMFAELKCYN